MTARRTFGFGSVSPDDEVRTSRPLTVTEELVNMLHNHLRRTGGTRKPCPSRHWAEDFDRLVESYGAETVRQALQWYADRAGLPGTPNVRSARSFLKAFPDILVLMDGSPGASETAKEIARRLDNLFPWPGQASAELPRSVEASLANYRPFLLRAVGRIGDDRLGRFCLHLTESGLLSEPARFVEDWFVRVGERYAFWKGWDGGLSSMIFTPSSRHLYTAGRDWSQQWCGSPFLWDQLVRAVACEGDAGGGRGGTEAPDRPDHGPQVSGPGGSAVG